MDDEDLHKVTAGSMVTVTVTLQRAGLLVSAVAPSHPDSSRGGH